MTEDEKNQLSDALSQLGQGASPADFFAASPAAPIQQRHHQPLRRVPFYARLSFRQTIIPILLTLGVAFPACAIWWLMQDEDSPLKSVGLGIPITMAFVGLVLLALGIFSMIQVKTQLAQDDKR
ncbi:MAG TPA: hypothetical protein VHS31_07005 [Tepidisphaeraceae bacterium]|jgi:hypothetical protein|nr:hypothetical protein [Tepidisphaeraceae bacterium]